MREAVMRDPGSVNARAWLSIYQTQKYAQGFESSAELKQEARSTAEAAFALDRKSPLALIAMGLVCLRIDQNYKKAIDYFEQARAESPGSDGALVVLSFAQSNAGQWQEAIQTMKQAVELNPRAAHDFEVLGMHYTKTRQFAKAFEAVDHALALEPDNWSIASSKAELLLNEGRLDAAAEILQRIPSRLGRSGNMDLALLRWKVATFRRDHTAALAIAQNLEPSSEPHDAGEKELLAGWSQLSLGQRDAALKSFGESRRRLEPILATDDNSRLHQRMARILAGLQNREGARAEAEKAVSLEPLSKEPNQGLEALAAKAEVLAQLGDRDEAISILEQLAHAEGSGTLITPALLQLDPVWDPIRNNPRFQKLCEENKP